MTTQMEAAMAQLGGVAGFAKQISALGAVTEISPAYEGETQGFKTFSVPCVFSVMPVDLILIVQDGAIAGLQTGAYSGGQKEEPAGSDAFDSISLALPVPGLGELPGTLTGPAGNGPFPAVVLLQGSGASDRDEAIGSLKPFRDIAEGLAARGVAVYRFDNRSYVYGAELMTKKDITLVDEYLEDAVNAVQLLAAQDRIDPDRIFVLGHSLGGNAVPAVARALEQQAEKDALFAELDRLQDPDSLTEDDMVAGVYSSYWKWLAAYDILKAAGEIEAPVLLLQGEEDYQVTMEDFGIWKDAFGDRANWQMISYPGAEGSGIRRLCRRRQGTGRRDPGYRVLHHFVSSLNRSGQDARRADPCSRRSRPPAAVFIVKVPEDVLILWQAAGNKYRRFCMNK